MRNIKFHPSVFIVGLLCLSDVSNAQSCLSRGCVVSGSLGCGFCDTPCQIFNDCCPDFLPACVEIPLISWQTSFIEVLEGRGTELVIPITIIEADGTALDADSGFESFFPFTVAIVDETAAASDDVILTTPTLIFNLDDVTTEITATVTIQADNILESDETFLLQITSDYGTVSPISSLQVLIKDVFCPEQVVVVDQHQLQGKKSTSAVSLYSMSNFPGFLYQWSKQYHPKQPRCFLSELEIDGQPVGFNLTIPASQRSPLLRLGYYISTFIYGNIVSSSICIGAPVTLRSDCLIPNERKSITVYPKEDGSPLLSDKLQLKVSATCFACSQIVWRKNNALLRNTGRRVLTISTVTEARGVFQVSRRRRARNGWFSLIEIIVPDCPEGFYQDDNGDCSKTGPVCKNNGVSDLCGSCQCPPCFYGPSRESVRPADSFRVGFSDYYQCSDLSNRRTCKGLLFCYGNLYGCSCGCGWHGHNCDQRCIKGKFGADCLQQCHCVDDDCDPQTGECANGCKAGWTGFNCQDPL